MSVTIVIVILVSLLSTYFVDYSSLAPSFHGNTGSRSSISNGTTTTTTIGDERNINRTHQRNEEIDDEDIGNLARRRKRRRRRRRVASFVPFPHNTLGSGIDVECEWETRISPPNDDIDYDEDDIEDDEGDAGAGIVHDTIQRDAFAEGICVPPPLNASLHVYSSYEARECLASRGVIISGDSYMKQLFVGLADVLLSTKLNGDAQMIGSVKRSAVVASANRLLASRHEEDASFPIVEYRCEEECYGYTLPFGSTCAKCINPLTIGGNGSTVAVVGAGVHIKHDTVGEIRAFLDMAIGTIFVSMPAGSNRSLRIYEGLLPYVAPNVPHRPFLDVYQLTRSCTMENCSYDGGHRSRYVNRWKAQLLLNTLCETSILGR